MDDACVDSVAVRYDLYFSLFCLVCFDFTFAFCLFMLGFGVELVVLKLVCFVDWWFC